MKMRAIIQQLFGDEYWSWPVARQEHAMSIAIQVLQLLEVAAQARSVEPLAARAEEALLGPLETPR